MSLESATYISDLNAANPPNADPIGQADDHLRLIKAAIKATFPNITGAVTSTQVQLNNLTPPGIISFWYGLTSDVPTGYALCDGRTVARTDGTGNITTPNLVDKFIRCAAGGTVAPAATGGALTHSHGLTIATHALSTGELPAHNHGVSDPGHSHTANVTDPGHSHGIAESLLANGPTASVAVPFSGGGITANTNGATTGITVTVNGTGTGISTTNTGSGTAHGHTGSTSDSQSNLPPFYGLVVVMKV